MQLQPPPEKLQAARRRLGLKQAELAEALSERGARCSAWTVERWETRSPTRRRAVPQSVWPTAQEVLGIDSVDTLVEAPNRPVAAIEAEVDPTAVARSQRPLFPPVMRPARPPRDIDGCCARFECARCGTVVVGEREARLHVCPLLTFLFAPSATLLAALGERDVAPLAGQTVVPD